MESRRLEHEAQADGHRPAADGATTNEIADSVYGSVHMTSANLQQFDKLLRELEETVSAQWGSGRKTLSEAIREKNIAHAQRHLGSSGA